jgi:hypothetical protein
MTACVAAVGCGWMKTRSDFERDPFVMSHLTHDKKDPMFAASENDLSLDGDEPRMQSASTSRKPKPTRYDAPSDPRGASAASLARADDYSWLEGRLSRQGGRSGGWYIRYATAGEGDRYGGQLRIVNNQRLGVAREGDVVRLAGRVVPQGRSDVAYEVASITILDE